MTIKENLQGEILIRETSTGKPVDVEEVKKEVGDTYFKEYRRYLEEGKSSVMLAKALMKRGIRAADAVLIAKEISNKKLLGKKLTISIVNDPMGFNPMGGVEGEQHSWAGSDITETTILPIIGDVVPGEFRKIAYSNNGKPWEEDNDNFVEDSDYTVGNLQCVVEQRIINNHYNNNDNEESEVYTLIVYIPDFKTMKMEKIKVLEALKVLGF